MEPNDAPKPINASMNTPGKNAEPIMSKEYELILDKDTYSLVIEIISKEKISFNIRQVNNISYSYFYQEYDYETLIKELVLPAQHYDNIEKIFKFYDIALEKKKVVLIYDNEKKAMILSLKITIFFDDIESKLALEEKQLTNEEMIKILFNEIRDIKSKKIPQTNAINADNNNKDEKKVKNEELESKINELIKENKKIKEDLDKCLKAMEEEKLENKKMKEDLDKCLKAMEEKKLENKKIKEDLDKCLKYIEDKIGKKKKEDELRQKMKEENEDFIKQNIKAEFKENPANLKLGDTLTTNATSCDQQSKFAVYVGLKDHIEYLVYNNKNNNNLDIMRIKDKTIITSLKGHNVNTIVIRYYSKDDKEEYILSSDANKLVIVWDIQNFFNKKFTIQAQYSGTIYDALLLFNVFNKDYILLSNSASNEYSKLYEFKKDTPFVRNILGTNDHPTYFMIPWFYQNKYYLIECSQYKIYINNMFEDENYANLSMDPEGSHYCGYLYNDYYLCVSDYNQKFIRIWDLVNKVIYKQINYDGTSNTCSYEIIPWNRNYTIFGCDYSFVIININEGKMVKKIDIKNSGDIRSVKKIKIGQYGECLICQDMANNGIQLYSL